VTAVFGTTIICYKYKNSTKLKNLELLKLTFRSVSISSSSVHW